MITSEAILTHPAAFGLTTATPVQRAICRAIDGVPLGQLADDPDVIEAFGGVIPPETDLREIFLLAGIRSGKSLLSTAVAVKCALTCDVSRLRFGETPRTSIVSLTNDIATMTFEHLRYSCENSPVLQDALLEVKRDQLLLRHPKGKEVEIKVVAGGRAGGTLVARWASGIIFDEAPRMVGSDEGVINLEHARKAVLGRMLPGSPVLYVGSPFARRGPVFNMVEKYWCKRDPFVLVIRATGPQMNPTHWTPERVAHVLEHDPDVYQTDVLGEFADPESGFLRPEDIKLATRNDSGLEPQAGIEYMAAMDPATRMNAWTLVIGTTESAGGGQERTVIVQAKQWKGTRAAPLNPLRVFEQIAAILKQYRVKSIHSDQHSADAYRAIAKEHGIRLVETKVDRRTNIEQYKALQIRLEARDVEDRPLISFPKVPYLQNDLVALRKKVTALGWSIDLPRTADGRHCDYAGPIAKLSSLRVRTEKERDRTADVQTTTDPYEERLLRGLSPQGGLEDIDFG